MHKTYKKCPDCNGIGRTWAKADNLSGPGMVRHMRVKCPECRGEGFRWVETPPPQGGLWPVPDDGD